MNVTTAFLRLQRLKANKKTTLTVAVKPTSLFKTNLLSCRALSLLAAGTTSCLLASCNNVQTVTPTHITPTHALTSSPDNKVLVVGAGLAGLTTAYELEKNGFDVTVLEASNHVGGRVHTQAFANGQYAEAGGELIDSVNYHPQMHHYINLFNLKLTDVGYDDVEQTAYYIGGNLFDDSTFEHALDEQTVKDDERFWQALAQLADLIPDPENPHLAPNASALDAKSAQDWIDSLHLSSDAKTMAMHHVRGEYGEPSQLSLLFLAQQQKVYQDADDDEIEIYRIQGGNQNLANAFANHLHTYDANIQLNSPVVAISQKTPNQVTAKTAQGRVYRANYAVVSVPATTLQRIEFKPALPPALQQASKINYGQHNKVLLQYSDRFWLKRGLGGDTVSELPIGWTWEATDQQDGDKGILIAYTSGDMSAKEAYLSDKQVVAKRQLEIETMYPEAKGKLERAYVYNWQTNPLSLGGYSAYAPKQVVPYWTAFHKPFNRIYFAGEHTDNLLPGYMEGAVRSGQRAAKQIINTYRQQQAAK